MGNFSRLPHRGLLIYLNKKGKHFKAMFKQGVSHDPQFTTIILILKNNCIGILQELKNSKRDKNIPSPVKSKFQG